MSITRLLFRVRRRAKRVYTQIRTTSQAPLVRPVVHRGVECKVYVGSLNEDGRRFGFDSYPVDHILEELDRAPADHLPITYYEIGANIGISCLLLAKALGESGTVVAFECEPANFLRLVSNIRLNGLTNVIALPFAVADRTALEMFYFNVSRATERKGRSTPGVGMHSLEENPAVHDLAQGIHVPVMPLETLIEEFSLPDPTHVFIDAYGAEHRILRGMSGLLAQGRIRKLMVQIQEKGRQLEDSDSLHTLRGLGFGLIWSEEVPTRGHVPGFANCVFALDHSSASDGLDARSANS